MAADIINMPAEVWTLLSSDSVSFQGLNNQDYFFTEGTELPTFDPRVPGSGAYNIGRAFILYKHDKLDGNMYVYAKHGQGLNVAIGPYPLEHTENQNKISPPVDLFFIKAKSAPDSLAVATTLDDITITVNNGGVFTVGDYIGIFDGAVNRFYFGEVLIIAANVLTVDTPLDYAYSIGEPVLPTTRDLNVDGSVIPQVFTIAAVSGGVATLEVDICRLMIQMFTDTVPQLSDFGDITDGLTRGLVLRENNGFVYNIWNVKDNGDFAHLAYDLEVYLASNPAQGQNGLAVRYTLNGQDKHDVAVRVGGGKTLQIIVQDDLTDIGKFRVIGEGSIAEFS
jgi:hypothetical protein